MIDIWQVIFNGLWIVGLAILLGVWSYARYAAYQAHVKTRDKLKEPHYAVGIDLGLLLFVAGMASTEDRLWGRILWALIGVAILVDAALRVIKARPRGALK